MKCGVMYLNFTLWVCCFLQSLGISYTHKTKEYCHWNPPTCRKRRLRGGGALRPDPSLYFIPQRCQVREYGEGLVKPPQSLNVAALNVSGCSIYVEKTGEISKMFLRRGLMRVI